MASAKSFLDKGDRNSAVIQLKNLLRQTPENGEARLLLGRALFDAEDYPSAEKELVRALELKQPQEKVLPWYAQTLLALGQNDRVVTEVAKYKLFDPAAVATTQTALGDAHSRLGNASRAREAYGTALGAVPGYPRARFGVAVLTAAEGQIDEAERQLDDVILADPTLAEAHAFRAELLLAKGDREGARKALETAVAANTRYLPARFALISLLIDSADLEGAAKWVETTRKVAPRDLRVNYFAALIAYRTGDTERALQQVQQVLKHLPDHVPSLVLAGALDLRERQLVGAENNLRRALARAPNHDMARQLLVQTYLRMGQPARARETLQPLIERGNPVSSRVHLLAGETFLANGDIAQATLFFRAATAAGQGQEAAAKTRLGLIALASGRSDEGLQELEAASELDPGQYQADLAIIAGHLQRKDFDKAVEAVASLKKKQPKNPLTYYVQGVVLLAKGDIREGRSSFAQALELQADYVPALNALTALDLAERRPEEARKRYEALTAQHPKNEQLFLALADLMARTGADAKDIEEVLRRAVEANPQSAAARVALINFQLQRKDAKAASIAAQSATAAMPSDSRVLLAAANALEAAGDINQAIELYGKVASLQPQSPQPLIRLAALYSRQKQYDNAIAALRRAQKVAAGDGEIVPQIVQTYLAAGRPEDALKEARDLQRRQPGLAVGFALEGEVQARQQRFPEAERAFREALKIEPNADIVARRLHQILVAGGKPAEARAFGKRWVADHPKDVAMLLQLGEHELASRNMKAAQEHYRAVIAMTPDNAVALNNLAWIGGQVGDPQAIAYAERAIALAPNSPAILDTYGTLLVGAGEVDKGLQALERARELAPQSASLRLSYAKALVKAGRKDAAREELKALQQVKGDFEGKGEIAGLLKALPD